MDAKELTKKYWELKNEVAELKKEVEYLKDEVQKLQMLTGDMEIDLRMLERSKR